MIHLEDEFQWLSGHEATISQVQEENKVLAFERGGLLWIFNFHPTQVKFSIEKNSPFS